MEFLPGPEVIINPAKYKVHQDSDSVPENDAEKSDVGKTKSAAQHHWHIDGLAITGAIRVAGERWQHDSGEEAATAFVEDALDEVGEDGESGVFEAILGEMDKKDMKCLQGGRTEAEKKIDAVLKTLQNNNGIAVDALGDSAKVALEHIAKVQRVTRLSALTGRVWDGAQGVLKTVLSWAQIVYTIPGTFAVQWPQGFLDFMNALTFVNLDIFSVISLDCAVAMNFYGTLLITMITPAVLIVLIFASNYAHLRATESAERRREVINQHMKVLSSH